VRADDLRRLHVPARKVLPFVVADGHRPAANAMAMSGSAAAAAEPAQAALF